MAISYAVGDRVVTPDRSRIGKIKGFSGTTKVIIEFEDDEKPKTAIYQIAAIRKAS